MIIRFKLNNIEFECEFTDVKEMLLFIHNLTINNRRKLQRVIVIMDNSTFVVK
jgi:hypothetical protein